MGFDGGLVRAWVGFDMGGLSGLSACACAAPEA